MIICLHWKSEEIDIQVGKWYMSPLKRSGDGKSCIICLQRKGDEIDICLDWKGEEMGKVVIICLHWKGEEIDIQAGIWYMPSLKRWGDRYTMIYVCTENVRR
jgi:hypothetical protein